jgi:hypothetical protein
MTSGRALAGAAAGLAVAALLLWGAAALPWPAPGAPSWTGGVALLALAGIAGVVATAGPVRRGVGVLLAAAGVAVIVGSVPQLAAAALGATALVVGGLALLATGGLVAAREPALARFGARYSRSVDGRPAIPSRPADPDRAAWDALDAGRDPTVWKPAATACRGCGSLVHLQLVYGRYRSKGGAGFACTVSEDLVVRACPSCGAGEVREELFDSWDSYPAGDGDDTTVLAAVMAPAEVDRLREVLADCPDPSATDCTCAVHEVLVLAPGAGTCIDVPEPPTGLPAVGIVRDGSGQPVLGRPAAATDGGAT